MPLTVGDAVFGQRADLLEQGCLWAGHSCAAGCAPGAARCSSSMTSSSRSAARRAGDRLQFKVALRAAGGKQIALVRSLAAGDFLRRAARGRRPSSSECDGGLTALHAQNDHRPPPWGDLLMPLGADRRTAETQRGLAARRWHLLRRRTSRQARPSASKPSTNGAAVGVGEGDQRSRQWARGDLTAKYAKVLAGRLL
jgi:hypothetical protein